MTVIASILQVKGAATALVSAVDNVKHLFNTGSEFRAEADAAVQSFAHVSSTLQDLHGAYVAHGENIPVFIAPILERQMGLMRAKIDEAQETLSELVGRRDENVVVLFFQREENMKKFAEITTTAEDFSTFAMAVCTLLAARSLSTTSQRNNDTFVANWFAPSLDDALMLDYTAVDTDGRPLTCEGELRVAVFDECASVSVVAGMGGTGKTSALKGLSGVRGIRSSFPGGVYLLAAGKEATETTLLSQLSLAVEVSGGLELSRTIRLENDFARAVVRTRLWFFGHPALFLVDDVWPEQLPEGLLDKLAMLVAPIGLDALAHRLVFSTRDMMLGRIGCVVSFEPRNPLGAISKGMLLRAAEVQMTEVQHVETAVDEILCSCQGLPLLLSITGRLMRAKLDEFDGDKLEVWREYARNLPSHRLELREELAKTVSASLDFLDSSEAASTPGPCLPHRDVLLRLCVLKKQDWAPVTFLQKLWRTRDERQAVMIVNRLARFRLAEKKTKSLGNRHVPGLQLHDLIHDYTHGQPEVQIQLCYRKVCESYRMAGMSGRSMNAWQWCSALVRELMFNIEPAQRCWPALLSDDGYIYHNIVRLLVSSGQISMAVNLLSDVRWVVNMMSDLSSPIVYLRDTTMLYSDIFLSVPFDGNTDVAIEVLELRDHHQALSSIMYESMKMCNNRPTRWFQLYARLLAGEQTSWTRRALRNIHQYADRPWFFPVARETGRGMERLFHRVRDHTFASPDPYQPVPIIRDISVVDNTRMIVCAVKDTKLLVQTFDGHRELSVIVLQDESALNNIRCACVSKDGNFVVSGRYSGLIQLWDLRQAQLTPTTLTGLTADAMAVSLSTDSAVLAVGAEDGSVGVYHIGSQADRLEILRSYDGRVSQVAAGPRGDVIVWIAENVSRGATVFVCDRRSGDVQQYRCSAWLEARWVFDRERRALHNAELGECEGDVLTYHVAGSGVIMSSPSLTKAAIAIFADDVSYAGGSLDGSVLAVGTFDGTVALLKAER